MHAKESCIQDFVAFHSLSDLDLIRISPIAFNTLAETTLSSDFCHLLESLAVSLNPSEYEMTLQEFVIRALTRPIDPLELSLSDRLYGDVDPLSLDSPNILPDGSDRFAFEVDALRQQLFESQQLSSELSQRLTQLRSEQPFRIVKNP